MRLLSILLSLVLFSSSAFSASIWHVTGKQEFYLFGTLHVLRPDTYPLPAVYERAMAQCDVLWLEVDIDELADPTIARSIGQKMRLPEGERLINQVSESTYHALQRLAEQAGLSLDYLQELKPWAVVNMLTLTLFQQQGFDVDHGLDGYLYAQAKEKRLPVYAFESLLWQIDLFDELARVTGDRFVEFSTNDIEQGAQLIENMVQYWQEGDVEALYDQADFTDYPDIEDRLLSQRNNRWMSALLNPTNKAVGTTCVAVGALHMASEKGLLAQFKAAGYTLQRLP